MKWSQTLTNSNKINLRKTNNRVKVAFQPPLNLAISDFCSFSFVNKFGLEAKFCILLEMCCSLITILGRYSIWHDFWFRWTISYFISVIFITLDLLHVTFGNMSSGSRGSATASTLVCRPGARVFKFQSMWGNFKKNGLGFHRRIKKCVWGNALESPLFLLRCCFSRISPIDSCRPPPRPPPPKKTVMRCVVVYRRLIYVPLSVRNIQLQHASLVTSAIVWGDNGAATSFNLALAGNRNLEHSSNRQR